MVNKMNGLRRIDALYWNRHILQGPISPFCSDPRCDSGDDGGPAVFSEGDWVFSKGNGRTRRLLCLTCSHHQHYITDEEFMSHLPEVEEMKH